MLRAEGLVKRFAGVAALDGASIEVESAGIVGLVGPNGSGKSTLLNVISGFLRPDDGRVVLGGQCVEGRTPWEISRLGLRRTFQLARQPERLSVIEVMLCGARLRIGGQIRGSLFRQRAVRAEEAEAVTRARQLLCTFDLQALGDQSAAQLSGGQQKLLSLATALMDRPRFLVLDEPTAGVSPALRPVLAKRLRTLRDEEGTGLLIVEHDMKFVQEVCDLVYVLDRGKTVTSCAPADLAADARVVEAYLGSRRGAAFFESASRADAGELGGVEPVANHGD